MIVYQATKEKFTADVFTNNIENVILDAFRKNLRHTTNHNEINAWKNSMLYMNNVLNDNEIPNDSGVTIEFQIPQTSKRIDFILTGQDEKQIDQAIIIELKQWSTAELTNKDGIVNTFVGGSNREVSHPSYQAWSYAALLKDFNQTVYGEGIELKPCAYLHNYVEDTVISNPFYAEYIAKAPLFLKSDAQKLQDFIKKFVKHGDRSNIMYRIDNGQIKPSKSLADNIRDVLTNKHDFVMIDDQKIVYETAMTLAKNATVEHKNVLIVQGGPGTGKSVVAVNLLVALTRQRKLAQYVTKNAAPRTVYEHLLVNEITKSRFSSLFTGSGSFLNTTSGMFDALIVDEAHRLNEKSGLFKNMGENQIKEIIAASKFSVFFVDEDQKVTLSDIGDVEEIIKWALAAGAHIEQRTLNSQFRCNGSDGYLAWLDNVLQIKETANTTLAGINYDFRVVGSSNELRDIIFEKNKINNKARLVAGYCWDWASKQNPNAFDITIPEHNFGMKWNLASDGNLWIMKPESVNEVGCIHTCQGLEVDYVGVIVGLDFVVRNGQVVTDPSKRAKTDASLKGYKKLLAEDSENGKARVDRIIKNTYRTLMTRGMRGCYVYFVDEETRRWFRNMI